MCVKEKEEIGGRALEPQKSQEPCRRREKSGRHSQKARELRGRRRNRKENSKKKLREIERMGESRKDWPRTS